MDKAFFFSQNGRMRRTDPERIAFAKFRAGQRAAARRIQELTRERPVRSDQAVREALSALAALSEMGLWPGPRDPVSERGVEVVRRRWVRIERRARAR